MKRMRDEEGGVGAGGWGSRGKGRARVDDHENNHDPQLLNHPRCRQEEEERGGGRGGGSTRLGRMDETMTLAMRPLASHQDRDMGAGIQRGAVIRGSKKIVDWNSYAEEEEE